VNTSVEFDCSAQCKSNVTWSYLSSASSDPLQSSLTTPCLGDNRCPVKNNMDVRQSVLNIDEIQPNDSGIYLCSYGTMNQPDYCEMSFNFTGSFLCILHLLVFCLANSTFTDSHTSGAYNCIRNLIKLITITLKTVCKH